MHKGGLIAGCWLGLHIRAAACLEASLGRCLQRPAVHAATLQLDWPQVLSLPLPRPCPFSVLQAQQLRAQEEPVR